MPTINLRKASRIITNTILRRKEEAKRRVVDQLPVFAKAEDGVDVVMRRPVEELVPTFWAVSRFYPNYAMTFRFAQMLALYSDILRSVLRALIGETFRNGVEVKKRYYKKCAVCGAKYDYDVPRCEVCGNETEWEYPDELDRRYLEEWIEKANLNYENLIDVLMAIEWDLDTVDNAFLLVRKKYDFDEEGRIVGAEPVEVMRADPKVTAMIMSRDGVLGMNYDGTKYVVTCPVHRDVVEEVDKEDYERGLVPRCSVCGKPMVKAVAYFREPGGGQNYLIDGEILHVKKYTYGIGYGYPPVLSLWLKVVALMRMDYFFVLAFTMQRSPKALLIFTNVNRETVERAWQYMMDKARVNPYIVYPLVLERAAGSGDIVKYIDISFKPEGIDLSSYRDEIRRTITAFYGVSPVFMGETGGGAGRDVMQILVTNRAIEMAQRIYNDKVLPWLTRQLGVEGWVIQLRPNEMRDEERRIRILKEKMQLIPMIEKLGYKAKLVQRGFDIDIVFQPAGEDVARGIEEAPKDLAQAKKENYYEEEEARNYVEGMPENERPRSGMQRVEGEPAAPQEEVEGGPGVRGTGA